MLKNDYDAFSMAKLLWAKTSPYKPLISHMIDAGCCAKAYLEADASSAILDFFAEQWRSSREETVSFIAYLTALHDIGKAFPQFQMENENELERLKSTEIKDILPATAIAFTRHEFLSEIAANRIWRSRKEDRRSRDSYACVLKLHHQKTDISERNKPQINKCWDDIQDSIENNIREIFGFNGRLPVPLEYDPVCTLLSGIVILCDWVASSDAFDDISSEDQYYEISLSTARAALKQYGLIENHRISGIDCFSSLWPNIPSPREIQQKCEKLDPKAPMTIIEAPMGEGKTEAALYLAIRAMESSGKRGIYVALPTQATSNQMFGRFVEMMKAAHGGNTRLLHGMAYLMNKTQTMVHSEDASEAKRWFGSPRMGLLDENGVGTIDQAMGAVILARFSALRLLGLSNKVLVIDELHAYDAYMSQIIESLLRWCRAFSVPVILLSATLQNSQKTRYLSCFTDQKNPEISKNYPLITQVRADQSIVQVHAEAYMQTAYHFEPNKFGRDDDKLARLAIDMISDGGCLCVLVNTVSRAQSVYRILKELKDKDTEIILFHARFTIGKREEIEQECLYKFGRGMNTDRPKKAVLVATQVVEQSLDIDFDGMISEIAPIDLLLQRAGRVHRHKDRNRPGKLGKPVVHVLMPDDSASDDLEFRYDSSGFVYSPFVLYNTEKLLGQGREIRAPLDVRHVIEQVYEHVSEENRQAWQRRMFDQMIMSANAGHISFPPPSAECFFLAQANPEFEDLNIDDGIDLSAKATTRLGEPTFRISFVEEKLFRAVKKGTLSRTQEEKVLRSSVSLSLKPAIAEGLKTGNIFRIERGVLYGCYVVQNDEKVSIGKKELINDPEVGVFWEG